MNAVGPQTYTIFVVDIEKFGSRTDPVQARLRGQLWSMLRRATAAVGLDWDQLPLADRGDGAFLLVPASVPKVSLIEPVIQQLDMRLREYNARAPQPEVMRLRLAVHAGEVAIDEGGTGMSGYVGADLNSACRLADLQVGRDCLAAAERSQLVVIASAVIYDSVIRHDHFGGLDPASFRAVPVDVKELHARAWIHTPGYSAPPGVPAVPAEPVAKPVRAAEEPAPAGGVTFHGSVTATTVIGRDGTVNYPGAM